MFFLLRQVGQPTLRNGRLGIYLVSKVINYSLLYQSSKDMYANGPTVSLAPKLLSFNRLYKEIVTSLSEERAYAIMLVLI